MRRRGLCTVIMLGMLIFSGDCAQGGPRCDRVLSWFGVTIREGKLPENHQGLQISFRRARNGKTKSYTLEGYRALILLAALAGGGSWLRTALLPDHPWHNISVQMPDGSIFNPNYEERKLWASLRNAKLGDSTDSTLRKAAESLSAEPSLPERIAFGETGLVGTRIQENRYEIPGLPGVTQCLVTVEPDAVVFRFEGGTNHADGQPLWVSVFVGKNGRIWHRLSTGSDPLW